MLEDQKSNGFRRKWSMHTGLRHHLPIPNQYMGGGYERVWFGGREKREPILGFPLKIFCGKMSC